MTSETSATSTVSPPSPPPRSLGDKTRQATTVVCFQVPGTRYAGRVQTRCTYIVVSEKKSYNIRGEERGARGARRFSMVSRHNCFLLFFYFYVVAPGKHGREIPGHAVNVPGQSFGGDQEQTAPHRTEPHRTVVNFTLNTKKSQNTSGDEEGSIGALTQDSNTTNNGCGKRELVTEQETHSSKTSACKPPRQNTIYPPGGECERETKPWAPLNPSCPPGKTPPALAATP